MKGGKFGLAVGVIACLQMLAVNALAAKNGDAVAYQVDVAHSGRGNIAGFKGKLKPLWTKSFGGVVSYPLITKTAVYITVAASPNNGSWLYALNRSNGKTLWQRAIAGTYTWSNATLDGDQLFVVNSNGVVSAIDASTGAENWNIALPLEYSFSSPPTAYNGMVFVDGAGEGVTLYGINESSGDLVWSNITEGGSGSSPAVSGDHVFVTFPCEYFGYSTQSGHLDWDDEEGCDGGGGTTPAYFDGSLYVRDPGTGNFILDAQTGAQTGTFSAKFAPSFVKLDKKTYVIANNGPLVCFDPTSGATLWTFSGDGKLSTAPILVGRYAIEGSLSGNLYVLKAATGEVVWSTKMWVPAIPTLIPSKMSPLFRLRASPRRMAR